MFPAGKIVIFSGAPAAGKSTLAAEWAKSRERGMVIPVDDIREWVVAGRFDPVPEWTEETARQFLLAEEAAASMALTYSAGGFDVALDHCRLPSNIDAWIARSFADASPHKVAVHPPLELVLNRNRTRSGKNFDPGELEEVIRGVHAAYSSADLSGWVVLENLEPVQSTLSELNDRLDGD